MLALAVSFLKGGDLAGRWQAGAAGMKGLQRSKATSPSLQDHHTLSCSLPVQARGPGTLPTPWPLGGDPCHSPTGLPTQGCLSRWVRAAVRAPAVETRLFPGLALEPSHGRPETRWWGLLVARHLPTCPEAEPSELLSAWVRER